MRLYNLSGLNIILNKVFHTIPCIATGATDTEYSKLELNVKNQLTQFMMILFTYLVIDVGYQISMRLMLMCGIHGRARIRDVTLEQPNHAWKILIFFLMIAFSILKEAVKPAIEKPTAGPQSRAVHYSESLPLARLALSSYGR